MKKRIVSLLLVLVLVCSVMPMPTVQVQAAGLSIQQIRDKFPQGAYWNGGNVDLVTWAACKCKHEKSHTSGSNLAACTCNNYNGSIQCAGFARKILSDAYRQECTNWPKKTDSSYIDQV